MRIDVSLRVDSDAFQCTDAVHYLIVTVDSELTMMQHAYELARACFYHIRRLKQICRFLGPSFFASLMGVASNRQDEAIASSWNLPNKKTTRLIDCVVCRKPRGGRPGYDSDQGRKFLFPYLTNTVCLQRSHRPLSWI